MATKFESIDQVYSYLADVAEKNEEGLVRGYAKDFAKELNLTDYKMYRYIDILEAMDCITNVVKASGFMPGLWELLRPPTKELFFSYAERTFTSQTNPNNFKMTRPSTRARAKDDFLRQNNRILELETRVARLETLLEGLRDNIRGSKKMPEVQYTRLRKQQQDPA